jgi:RNA polymerase sigma-70 factor (ECF subfamily)
MNLQTKSVIAKNARMNHANNMSERAIEAEWLEIQAAQQDPALFRPLYERYFETIFRFIYRRVTDEALSSDICSKVFLKALQNINAYSFRGVPFSSWLYRLAGNEVAQYYRQQKKKRVVSIEDSHINSIIESDEPGDQEQQLQQMISALDQLREKDLILIELRFFEERPFKEIAEIIGITEPNAKMKTYRALNKLRKLMSHDE